MCWALLPSFANTRRGQACHERGLAVNQELNSDDANDYMLRFHGALGQCYMHMGRNIEARRHFSKALRPPALHVRTAPTGRFRRS